MNITLRRILILVWLAVFVSVLLIPTNTVEAETPPLLRRLRVPALMYHYISVPPPGSDIYRLDLSVTPENFTRQMEWLRDKHFTPISTDDLIVALRYGAPLPSNPILLTFDDGYDDAYINAFPILKSFGFKGTFFIVTNWLDQGREGYLSWDQAKEMADAGMSIQSHSRAHVDMRNESREWLDNQIVGSAQDIEDHIGVRPAIFCYPGGGFDRNVIAALKLDGIAAAFTTQDGTYLTSDGMYRLPRVRVRGSTTIQAFASLLQWKR